MTLATPVIESYVLPAVLGALGYLFGKVLDGTTKALEHRLGVLEQRDQRIIALEVSFGRLETKLEALIERLDKLVDPHES